MIRVTNKGIIEYKAIIGFKAVLRENGLYHIYATLKDPEDRISTHLILKCKVERLYDTWNGIRNLANLLTLENYFIEI